MICGALAYPGLMAADFWITTLRRDPKTKDQLPCDLPLLVADLGDWRAFIHPRSGLGGAGCP